MSMNIKSISTHTHRIEIYKKNGKNTYGSGHEGVAVLLPGFAIKL